MVTIHLHVTHQPTILAIELQHISKKYPILSVFYRYQKRFKYHILAHIGKGCIAKKKMHVIVFTWGFLVKWRLSHVQLKGQWYCAEILKKIMTAGQ